MDAPTAERAVILDAILSAPVMAGGACAIAPISHSHAPDGTAPPQGRKETAMIEKIVVGIILVVAAGFTVYRLFFRPSCGCGPECGCGRDPDSPKCGCSGSDKNTKGNGGGC